MKGLELSGLYYREYGAPMIRENFPEIEGRIAVGLAGEGSECLGFDDDVSSDHDFEPSFCMWLTRGDFEKYALPLTRAYNALPKDFMGYRRASSTPTGGARRGVLRTEDFYRRFLGSPAAPSSYAHWLAIPEHALCAATSGRVFRDDLGVFSEIRAVLSAGYPEDVRLKKLASALISAHQSGVYNYPRCLSHGENGAAQLAVYAFVKNIIASVYLLNNRYMPFYKWVYRGMRDLAVLPDLAGTLARLTETGNSPDEAEAKRKIINDICISIASELRTEGLLISPSNDLESAAYEVNGRISDPSLRNESIFAGMMRE